eukprot:8023852-Pyramimonas_sp.AAC.1
MRAQSARRPGGANGAPLKERYPQAEATVLSRAKATSRGGSPARQPTPQRGRGHRPRRPKGDIEGRE